MIHFGKLPTLMARKGADGMPLPFSLKYVKKSTGEIISIEQAVLTSSNHLDYFNVMILPSREIRKLILPLIIEFNGTPTFI